MGAWNSETGGQVKSEDEIRAALASTELRLSRLAEVYAAPGDTIAALIAEKRRLEVRIETLKEVLEDGE
jgi:hypothetical protein